MTTAPTVEPIPTMPAATLAGLSESAFRQHYAQLLNPVFHYIRYRLGPGEANDLTADVFTKAWTQRGQFDSTRGTAEAWLWAIARHTVTDALRRQALHSADTDPTPWREAARRGDSGDMAAAWAEALAALADLAAVDQEIIALRFGGEWTNRAIAAELGLSEANVAQRLRRALLALRKRLGDEEVAG